MKRRIRNLEPISTVAYVVVLLSLSFYAYWTGVLVATRLGLN